MKKKTPRKVFEKCTVELELEIIAGGQPHHRVITTTYGSEEIEKNYNRPSDWWSNRALEEYLQKKGLSKDSINFIGADVFKE